MSRVTRSRPAIGLARALFLAAALGGTLGAASAPVSAFAAPAPAAAAQLVGKPVRDADGKTLGVIEKVITGADGSVRQVQVRTRKGPVSILRTLSFKGLIPSGDGYNSVLTQAEYDAIPASPEP